MIREKPRFSVVIPCYNEARFIERTLQSLKQQTFNGAYEIIIVDNNCTDNTVEIAKKYHVRVVTENHPGVCWARQAGTAAARGEIVVSTDADTTFRKTWLETIDQAFRRKDYIAVAGPCIYSDGPWWGKQYPKFLFGTVNLISYLIGRPFYITATNVAFKKSAWDGYHTTLTQGGDELGLLHDLRRKGKVVFNNANPVYTSGRRLYRGLFYNFFMTFLVYYMLAYYLNRLFGRQVMGTAPKIRVIPHVTNRWGAMYRWTAAILIIGVIHLPGRDTLLEQSYETATTAIRVIWKVV